MLATFIYMALWPQNYPIMVVPYPTLQLTSQKRMNVSDVKLPVCSILFSSPSMYLKSFIYDHIDASIIF